MALQKTMLLVDNFDVPVEIKDCYIKVASVSGGKKQLKISLEYKRGSNNPTFHSEQLAFVPSTDDGSANFIRQAYEYLKTLDEFSNSQDV